MTDFEDVDLGVLSSVVYLEVARFGPVIIFQNQNSFKKWLQNVEKIIFDDVLIYPFLKFKCYFDTWIRVRSRSTYPVHLEGIPIMYNVRVRAPWEFYQCATLQESDSVPVPENAVPDPKGVKDSDS